MMILRNPGKGKEEIVMSYKPTPSSRITPIVSSGTIFLSRPKEDKYWIRIPAAGNQVKLTLGCVKGLELSEGDKLAMSREGNRITFVKSDKGDISYVIHKGRYNNVGRQSHVLNCSSIVIRTLRAALMVAFCKTSGILYCEVSDRAMIADAGRQRELMELAQKRPELQSQEAGVEYNQEECIDMGR